MQIIEGGIYRRTDRFDNWCHHGIVFITKHNCYNSKTQKYDDERLIGVDTYWNSGFSISYLEGAAIWDLDKFKDNLEFIMMIDDIKEVRENEFWDYNKKDRLYLPIGGWHERYLVNKNAKPNKELMRENILDKIEEAKSKIRSAEYSIERYKDKLKALDET
jgi:hypothetical protein